jgi:hypothetical protein
LVNELGKRPKYREALFAPVRLIMIAFSLPLQTRSQGQKVELDKSLAMAAVNGG